MMPSNRITFSCHTDVIKREADVLFSNQELTAAIDKYTEALQLIPYHVSCYSNRSACKMAQKDLKGCIEDCSVAISLLMMDVSGANGGKNAIVGGKFCDAVFC